MADAAPRESALYPEPTQPHARFVCEVAAPVGRTVELGRAYAEHLQATVPEHFASFGVTASEFAERFAAPGFTIDEAVAVGEMSPAEGRFLQFCATREDLVELGHTPDEIDTILEEQRAHACASSS